MDTDSELRFDQAIYTPEAGGAASCASCHGPFGDSYFKLGQSLLCAGCRDRVADRLSQAQSVEAFGKAALLGAGTAFGCGVTYAVLADWLHVRAAIVTIGIAYAIANVVRKASGGAGGLPYQILSVGLTYVASAMGYLPIGWSEIKSYTLEHYARTLMAPFTNGILGIVIVGFGLREAWRLSRGVLPLIEGPYRVTRAPAP